MPARSVQRQIDLFILRKLQYVSNQLLLGQISLPQDKVTENG